MWLVVHFWRFAVALSCLDTFVPWHSDSVVSDLDALEA